MLRGVKLSGVKKIRLHDIRRSHTSLLVEMGCSPLISKELPSPCIAGGIIFTVTQYNSI